MNTAPVDEKSPLSVYVDTAEQRRNMTAARAALVSSCMRRLGFTDFKTVESKEAGPELITSRRYLYIEPARAARNGYAVEPDPTSRNRPTEEQVRAVPMEERRALTGGGVTLSSGVKAPEGGCTREAGQILSSKAPRANRLLVWQLMAKAAASARKDAEVMRAATDWSACMKQGGYAYATPEEAWNDSRWGRQPVAAVSEEERKVATADMECKDRSGYAVRLSEAQIANEKQLLEQHADELKALARNREALLRNTEILLQGGRP
ncbi:hypothetical protein [Streptosporangium sp. NPDC023615]|uniref:hypothetical protein n=1 Tax=Streptosporangium sp. NPDC023615 TaxID=3154794 RepID=UPI003441F939